MKKFKNKYRVYSSRLQNWNYGWKGSYFITICTKNRIHYFGEIVNSKMILSEIGIIADILWYEIKNHTKNVDLGAFVLMPNHIHGILILTRDNTVRDAHQPEQSQPSQKPKTIGQQRFQNIGKNTVSSIIGLYKSAVTKHASRLGYDFTWQPLFYDHIIRNPKSYQNISEYIINNPVNWNKDKFFKSK